jgi:hypothetical protein
MISPGLGPWIAVGLAVHAVVVAFAAALALRGSQPEHRAEILKALAVLALALFARRPGEGPRSRRPPPRKLSPGSSALASVIHRRHNLCRSFPRTVDTTEGWTSRTSALGSPPPRRSRYSAGPTSQRSLSEARSLGNERRSFGHFQVSCQARDLIHGRATRSSRSHLSILARVKGYAVIRPPGTVSGTAELRPSQTRGSACAGIAASEGNESTKTLS